MTITWIAFLLRANNLAAQSLWRDEVDAIRFSSWSLQELLAGLFQEGHNGPLFFLLLRPWRALTGNGEFALRYPSALMGTLAVPLGFVLARQLGFSRRTGLLLGLLLATSPYLVWYGQEAKMYAALLAAVTLAFIAYLKALGGAGKKWWALFVAGTSISFYLHILSPLMLMVYTVVALLHGPQLRRHRRAWLVSMACLTLPYVPLALWQISFLLSGAGRGHPFYPLREEFYLLLQLYTGGLLRFAGSVESLLVLAGNFVDSFGLATSGLLGIYRSHLAGAIGVGPIVLFVFLLLGGLFLGGQRASQERLTPARRASLAAWMLLPPLVVYVISLRVPVFEDRYLIYISPAFYLLAALGLVLVRQYSVRLANFCLVAILAINLLGIWQQQRQPIKPDFRAAAQYLASQPHPPNTIMVQMPYLRHTLNYYYPHPYTYLEGLWTNGDTTEATVATQMTRLTADLSSLWLVVSEEDTWDRRHLVRNWLNQNAQLANEAHFMRVDVYHYQFGPGTIDAQSTGATLD